MGRHRVEEPEHGRHRSVVETPAPTPTPYPKGPRRVALVTGVAGALVFVGTSLATPSGGFIPGYSDMPSLYVNTPGSASAVRSGAQRDNVVTMLPISWSTDDDGDDITEVLDEVTEPVEDVTDPVVDTTEEVVDTTEDVVDTVEDTVEPVLDPVVPDEPEETSDPTPEPEPTETADPEPTEEPDAPIIDLPDSPDDDDPIINVPPVLLPGCN